MSGEIYACLRMLKQFHERVLKFYQYHSNLKYNISSFYSHYFALNRRKIKFHIQISYTDVVFIPWTELIVVNVFTIIFHFSRFLLLKYIALIRSNGMNVSHTNQANQSCIYTYTTTVWICCYCTCMRLSSVFGSARICRTSSTTTLDTVTEASNVSLGPMHTQAKCRCRIVGWIIRRRNATKAIRCCFIGLVIPSVAVTFSWYFSHNIVSSLLSLKLQQSQVHWEC